MLHHEKQITMGKKVLQLLLKDIFSLTLGETVANFVLKLCFDGEFRPLQGKNIKSGLIQAQKS